MDPQDRREDHHQAAHPTRARRLPAAVRQREETPRPAQRTAGSHPRHRRGRQQPGAVSSQTEPPAPENVGTARLTCGQPASQTPFPQASPKREDLTISQPRWQPAPSAFSLFKGCFRLYFSRSTGVCRGMPSCPVGNSWGRPGTRTCGISVGRAGGLRGLTQSARSEISGSGFGACFTARPACLAAGSRGDWAAVAGLISGAPGWGRLLGRWSRRAHPRGGRDAHPRTMA